MSTWVTLAVVEAVVFIGAWIDAKMSRRSVLARWAWWHLVIMWATWLSATWVILRIGEPAMHRAALAMVARSRAERASEKGWVLDVEPGEAKPVGRTLGRWSPSWGRLSSLR